MRISVCIASIGRVSLIDTLTSIAECELPPDISLEIVIADDSLDGCVTALLHDVKSNWGFQLEIFSSASKNIAIARNVCLSHATGEYLAFIDDDETADKLWLSSFLNLAERSKADAIFGAVDAIFPTNAPQWVCAAKPFVKRAGKNGEHVNTGSTCNAFVRRKAIEKWALRFNPAYGQSGGEDTAFFAELHRMGGKLVATNDAKVSEVVPLSRLKISHLQNRYIRGGQTYARLFISPLTPAKKFRAYLLAALKVTALLAVIPVLFVTRRDVALMLAFKFWLNIGRLKHMANLKLARLY